MEMQFRLVTKGREVEVKLNLNRLLLLIALMTLDTSLIESCIPLFLN